LQLAFGRALKQLNQYEYRGSGSFLAWLQQIAKNVLRERLEYWQADKRTPLREQKAASPGISSHTGPGDDPERLVSPATGPVTAQLRSEKQERITDLLSQLPERDYLIVWFRFFGGASWAEVAELVGAASADAVRIECVQRIFPKLAPLLGNDQDD
jgi:RNA polymerase sigma factor (sigma-70 family)